MQRVHLYISGTVQGVTFRASTRRKADDVGVDGWIRNLEDGRVEAVFEGSQEQVEEMVQYCHHGPTRADVQDVSVEEEEPENLAGFEIKETV